MSQRIALSVEYQGADFSGWQKQSGRLTVEGALEKAVSFVANEPIKLHCAGRTDSGVHALNQIVHFDTDAVRDMPQWLMGINSSLPTSIVVHAVTPVPDTFHARFSATARRYVYVIANQAVRSAVLARLVTWHMQPLALDKMKSALPCMIGKHDFSAFRAAGCQANNPVRDVSTLEIHQSGAFIFIEIAANAFLHHMVRNIVGSLLRIGEGLETPEWLSSVLESRNREMAGVTARSDGLYLVNVDYPREFSLPQADYLTTLVKRYGE
jgi:tRNA pseudouridine38-40 synthase